MSKKTKPKNNRKINNRSIIQSLAILLCAILSFLMDKVVVNIVNVIQQPLLFKFFYTITLFGEIYIFIWIALILIAALMIYHRPIAAFILTLATTLISEAVLKLIVNRSRPFEAMHIASSVYTNMSSFPSGHTLIFFSIIPIMSKNFPKIKIVFWVMAVLVGLSRLYLGVHYFSDVVCGAILGFGIGWICMKTGEKYAWKY
jgi:undecaprenyl-diphosphatase